MGQGAGRQGDDDDDDDEGRGECGQGARSASFVGAAASTALLCCCCCCFRPLLCAALSFCSCWPASNRARRSATASTQGNMGLQAIGAIARDRRGQGPDRRSAHSIGTRPTLRQAAKEGPAAPALARTTKPHHASDAADAATDEKTQKVRFGQFRTPTTTATNHTTQTTHDERTCPCRPPCGPRRPRPRAPLLGPERRPESLGRWERHERARLCRLGLCLLGQLKQHQGRLQLDGPLGLRPSSQPHRRLCRHGAHQQHFPRVQGLSSSLALLPSCSCSLALLPSCSLALLPSCPLALALLLSCSLSL